MKPAPFDPETDLATTPFEGRHCQLAAELKDAGLRWTPHVGCFVWDQQEHIEVSSPFPGRIYFTLNLGHFLKTFDTVEEIAENLVWLPTWHQARLLCEDYGVGSAFLRAILSGDNNLKPGDELLAAYALLLQVLKTQRQTTFDLGSSALGPGSKD
jgi:hypothetical protein